MAKANIHQWEYDVFLSFRGEDTRKNFTDHLYSALHQKGIITFKDDERLEKGKEIGPELVEAIEKSRFTIVIFSTNYASSSWCLDELAKIVECMKNRGQVVFPVFYGVDPSILQRQKGNFDPFFAKHEQEHTAEKVEIWRTALATVANLSGYDLQGSHESEAIKRIVREIWKRLNHTISSSTIKNLVGMESNLERLKPLLGSEGVCIIGIHGMGGIGKTTLARVIFERISNDFDACSFLANVREVSKAGDLVTLQRQLLCETLMEKDIKLWDIYGGVNMISKRLRNKKVLLILDDVDELIQLEKLVGNRDWFASGSKIIITTRDVHLLQLYGVDGVYKMEGLKFEEALQLFCLKAFKTIHPAEDFAKMSIEVVKQAHGLPLALEVFGSFLHNRSIEEWRSALVELEKDSGKEVLDRLEISFYGLSESGKKIFLDIACFYKGMNKDYVKNFCPAIGIGVLVDKSLVSITYNNELWMHDLLQEMGQNIIRKESPNEPGKRSRLWVDEDICSMFERNTGTESVEMITTSKSFKRRLILNENAFSKMNNLRVLKISNSQLPKGLKYLPSNLQHLEWHEYPLKSLPSAFHPDGIIEINLQSSSIKQLWNGSQIFEKLKFMNLSYSWGLDRTPDITGIPNLEELDLQHCASLKEVHPSILPHKRLKVLNLRDCASLKRLSDNIEMESLQVLRVSGCFKLKNFPEIKGKMEHLSKLYLDGTTIHELPLSIGNLTGLMELDLTNCKNLQSLPSNICGFKYLRFLILSGCRKLHKLPERIGDAKCLEKLDVSWTAIRQPPPSISLLKNLSQLSFRGCGEEMPKSRGSVFGFLMSPVKSLDSMCLVLPHLLSLRSLESLDLGNCDLTDGAIPADLGSLSSLQYLYLGGNKFNSLPASISRLSKLEFLSVKNCMRLQSIPQLPASLTNLTADNCSELEIIPNQLELCISKSKVEFILVNCNRTVEVISSKSLGWTCLKTYLQGRLVTDNKFSHEFSFRMCLPGSEIPEWINNQNKGSKVSIDIPLHWKDSSAMFLYAICVVFRPMKYSRNDRCKELVFNFLRDGKGKPLRGAYGIVGVWMDKEFDEIRSDHVWLFCADLYITRDALKELNRITISFERSFNLEIVKCGGRLMRLKDLNSLNHDFS